MKEPKFLVICGGDGSGKSTQIEVLKNKFDSSLVQLTREPGGSVLGEEIRKLVLDPIAKASSPETFTSLMWAARHDHLQNTIKPALTEGRTVISDRFDCCTYAYQIYGQEALHLEPLFWQTRENFLGNTVPHAYVFLDVDPEVGLLRRAHAKGLNHFDEKKLDFHKRVQAGYRAFFEEEDISSVVIDANQSLEKVTGDFLEAIENILAD